MSLVAASAHALEQLVLPLEEDAVGAHQLLFRRSQLPPQREYLRVLLAHDVFDFRCHLRWEMQEHALEVARASMRSGHSGCQGTSFSPLAEVSAERVLYLIVLIKSERVRRGGGLHLR